MQMKKRVLSMLLALCLAGSLASTAWAAEEQATPETAADTSAVVLNEEEEQQEETSGEDSTAAPTEDPVAQVTETEADDGSVKYTAALETDGQTMNVVVTAPEGAFEEDVQPELSVTMLTAEDELNAVADKLDTADVQYDGFAALDITFTDKTTGEEVEPVKSVAVRIELPQAIVDSGIDLNTLAVQHLEEDENGDVKNVAEVATLDNGITLSEEASAAANEAAGVAPMSDMPAEEATAGDATETPAAVAEFEVDGFSGFVITWQGSKYKNAFNITVKYVYVNDNDEPVEIADSALDILEDQNYDRNSDDVQIDFSQYQVSIPGYNFVETRYQYVTDQNRYADGKVMTRIVLNRESGRFSTSYNLEVYNRGTNLLADNNTWTSTNDPKDRTIYMIYKKVDEGQPTDPDTGTVTENATVTTGKSAVLRNDGNYDLTLSISGDRGNKTKKQAVDVLFIVDRSGSMTRDRQNALDSAVETLITTLQSDRYKDNIDAQYGVVAFAGSKPHNGGSYYDYGTTSYNWTNDGNATLQWIKNLNFEGGTNYQQAIYTGKEMLENRSNDRKQNATTFVIFISDGIPTYRGINVTNGTEDRYSANGNGSDDDDGKNIAAAKTEIATMTCDYFYAIGMGDDFGQEQEKGDNEWQNGHWVYVPGEMVDKQGTTNLKALANAVNADYAGDDHVYSANDEDLSDAFGDITATITFFAATDVTITDPLSDYADLVLTSGAPQFTITVTREASDDVSADSWSGTVGPNGTVTFRDAKGNNQTATARVSEDNSIIYMDLPDAYELEPGYTYSISTVITPSDQAKLDYASSKEYPATPDSGTGTHADQNDKGFWSNDNDNAKVTFTANGEDGSQAFPKPVIQVPEIKTADLTITKDVRGIDSADLSTENGHESIVEGQGFSFTVEKLDEDGKLDADFEENDFVGGKKTVEITVDANGDGTAVLEDLPLGEYKVTESDWPQEFGDYTFDTKSGEETASLEDENGDSVTVINTYKHKDKVLTVKKFVAGTMVTDGDKFNFTLALTDENGKAYTGEILSNDELARGTQDGEYTFTLTGNMTTPDSLTITLPYNVRATVTEATVEGYTTVEHREYATESTEPENFTEGPRSDMVTMNQDYTIEFRNTKNLVGPPTGLERNDTPYTIMVTAAGIAGLALIGGMVVRRRRRRME